MQPEDVQQVIGTLREQLASLAGGVASEQRARVAAFEQDKPQLRQLIQALEGSRSVLEAELKELQQQPAGPKTAVKKTTAAIASGIGNLKSKQKPAGGPKMSDDELRSECQQLSSALGQLDDRIAGIRRDISRGMRADEREMWETNLVMLQVRLAVLCCFCQGTLSHFLCMAGHEANAPGGGRSARTGAAHARACVQGCRGPGGGGGQVCGLCSAWTYESCSVQRLTMPAAAAGLQRCPGPRTSCPRWTPA